MGHRFTTVTVALLLSVSGLTYSATANDFSVVGNTLSTWNQTEWSLTANQLVQGQFQSRLNLANGYVGAALAAAGPFFEIDVNQTDPNGIQPTNGWPLFDPRISFSTISGFFDIQPNGTGTNYPWLNQYGYESFISGIPHPTALIFGFNDVFLDATVKNSTISNFAQKISFKTGVTEWTYTWSPENVDAVFNVSYTTLFSKVRPNVIAVKAVITSSKNVSGMVTDLLDGRSATRTYLESKSLKENTTSMYSAVHPNGLANVTGYVFSTTDVSNSFTDLSSRKQASGSFVSSNDSTIGQTWNISLLASQPAIFYKYVGIASTDVFPAAELEAEQSSLDALSSGFDKLLEEHVAAWSKLMTATQIDEFTDPTTGKLPNSEEIQILQIASIANTFYLLQNLNEPSSSTNPSVPILNDNSIAVGGLSSDSYAGLIFWDADYWMAPGINIAFPSFAQQIPNFRLKQHAQAIANAEFNNFTDGAALYSWTAGRYGNCTGTGPCVDYEYHLNYDIAFNMLQYRNVTADDDWWLSGQRKSGSSPLDMVQSVANMTGQLLVFNETTQSWWIQNMTDPDEYANNVNNGAFTMGSAAELLNIANSLFIEQGLPINQTWMNQSSNIEFPRAASNITLEYQTMNNSVEVKQADVVLLTYPLDFQQNYNASTKLLDLDYYSNRQSQDGPAMTYSIFAIDANALSPSGCAAFTYTLNGFIPYLRAPFYQFSEQAVDDANTNGGINPAFPFLTGHGGANQVIPFGYLGLRTDREIMYINPALPPQVPQVRVRDFFYAGAGFSAFMNQSHTTITRFDTSNNSAVFDKFANKSMSFAVGAPGVDPGNTTMLHTIAINQTITIPNRQYFSNLTMPGNVLQCLPVIAESAYAPGQFPQAAVDGASATQWQPATNETSSFLINTTSLFPSNDTIYPQISSLYFNWASRPPRNVTLIFGNHTSIDNLTFPYNSAAISNIELIGEAQTIRLEGITPSLPTQGELVRNGTSKMDMTRDDAEVIPYVGNETRVDVEEGAWLGRWVRVVVEGCWVEDGVGATVSEVVVVPR